MILDEWLDIRGGPSLEKASLIISVQLHDTPPQSIAEAAVGVLLAWAPLAERYALETQALLHRPVEAGADGLDGAVFKALLWGKTTADEARDLWQVSLSQSDKRTLLQAASDTKLAVFSQTDGFSRAYTTSISRSAIPGYVPAGWPSCSVWSEQQRLAYNNS